MKEMLWNLCFTLSNKSVNSYSRQIFNLLAIELGEIILDITILWVCRSSWKIAQLTAVEPLVSASAMLYQTELQSQVGSSV